jgi:Flp pilus assembly protein TadD
LDKVITGEKTGQRPVFSSYKLSPMTTPQDKNALVNRIYQLMSQRDFQSAGQLCEQLTNQFPGFDEGWIAAAEFFLRVNNPSRALELVQKAVALDSANVSWLLMHARCLLECGQAAAATDAIENIRSAGGLQAQQHNELGMLLSRIDHHEAAQKHYQQAVAAQPGEVEFLFNLATSQRFLGEIEAAEATLDTILRLQPTDHEAAAMRSSLRKARPDSNHVEELKVTFSNLPLSPAAQTSFCYALAKELEDLESYPESFGWLKRGADVRRSGMRYQVATDVEIIDSIIEVFDADYFAQEQASTDNENSNKEAFFVIGLPRSGTTLLERILGSHSQVHAAGELGNFGIELTKLTRTELGGQPADRKEFVAASGRINYPQLGENYIASTRPLTGHTSNFIDKLPFNYLYAGLIHRALPGSRIISLRRHPMDSCYSMYKQLFRDAYPFSYDLDDLAAYYIAYHRLMQHWQVVIPGVIHMVQYEDLVSNTEGEARRLLEFCGLEWEDQVLEYHRSKSASTTASATQVRQKVYTSSVGKWQRYERELAPLKQRLEQAGIDCSPIKLKN